jgi:hypothetical protein
MYLVYTEYAAHCVHDVIIGVCENMKEVIESVWTFSRFILRIEEITFEESNHLIYIAKITKENYDILKEFEKKYEEDFVKYMDKPYFREWSKQPDDINVTFWYGVFRGEEKSDVLFSEEDCKIIENIIGGSELLE